MDVTVGVDLHSVLEPRYCGPWFATSHADEHDLVPELELVVKVAGLRYPRALKKK